MRKNNILSIIVIFITLSVLVTVNAKPLKTCAIVPFGSTDDKHAAEITAMRNSYEQLVKESGKYQTINNTIKELVDAGYFGKKYTSTTSAAMNAGIILDANFVIYGQTTKSGKTYTLTTSLVDIHKSKVIRSIRTQVKGDINDFANSAPPSNVNSLLKVKLPPIAGTQPKKIVEPATVAATPVVLASTKHKQKKKQVVKETKTTTPKPKPKKRPKKEPFDWSASFSWANQTQSAPDFNETEYENEFMQYLKNHLELGGRITSFSLDEPNGEFLGTINLLAKEDTVTPFKLFADWMFNPYIGIELTYDSIGARTYTDTEDNHSDGILSMSGPVVYAFGRYPFQIKTTNLDFIIAPYLGIGFAMFSSDFSEDTWWAHGFGSPAQWDAAGSPEEPTGEYSRTIDVKDSTGMVIAGGCTIKLYRGISLDFYMRIIDADTDAVFTRTHTTTGDYDKLNGHFPMKTTGYGFGLRYAF